MVDWKDVIRTLVFMILMIALVAWLLAIGGNVNG